MIKSGIIDDKGKQVKENMVRAQGPALPVSSKISRLGDDLNNNMSVNMSVIRSNENRIIDGAISGDKVDYTTINHDALLNYEAKEHIDWTATGPWTIDASNYTETDPVWESEKANYALATALDDYALKTNLDDYVSNTGDTMTGDYDINGSIQADNYLSSDGSTGITDDVDVVIDVRDNAGQLQKMTQSLSFKNGLLVHEGTASAWTDTTDIQS
jgi:hypothetical protein